MLLAMAEQAYPPLVSETSQFLSAGSANAFFFDELQLHVGADAAHAWLQEQEQTEERCNCSETSLSKSSSKSSNASSLCSSPRLTERERDVSEEFLEFFTPSMRRPEELLCEQEVRQVGPELAAAIKSGASFVLFWKMQVIYMAWVVYSKNGKGIDNSRGRTEPTPRFTRHT